MGDQAEIWRLVNKVEGEEELKKLEKSYENLDNQLRKSIATAGAGTAASEALAQKLVGLSKQIDTTKAFIDGASRSSVNFGNAFVQLGYAADDARYGVAGLANNIQPLLSAFGLGSGLAGVIGIAVAAGATLYTHLDDLNALFGEGKTEKEAEEFERLSKAISKSADEQARFNKLSRERQSLKTLVEGEPKETTQARQAAQGAVNELPGGFTGLAKSLADGRNPNGYGPNTIPLETQKQITDQKGFIEGERNDLLRRIVHGGDVSGAEQILKDLQAKGLDEGKKAEFLKAQDDINKAIADPEKFKGLVADLRRRGLGKQANELEAAVYLESPEAKRIDEKIKEDEEENKRRLAKTKQRKKQGPADEAALTDEDQKESDKRLARRKQQREARVKDLAAGSLGTDLLQGREVSAADVKRELGKAGVKNVSDDLAERYRKKLGENINEQVQDRALKDGTSEKDARKAIVEERRDKAVKKARADFDKQLDKYEEDHPGFKKLLEANASGGFERGGSGGAELATNQLLKRAGLSKGNILFGASLFAHEAGDAARSALGKQLAERHTSQVIASPDFSTHIQQAVGGKGNEAERTARATEALLQFVKERAQRPPGRSGVFFGS
jgi:hypothetical protein